ncbi:glycosyltransferase family 2 protein [Chitinophaga silvatica]|uniref:Glycosyltransferase family 2 protein n=1 Tax=Chitinophaga silvatica TaxID=2282649 RepID=A0A3E1YI17_9BACT|nr:glycosyltransferase family A protein [Chitinophaga silvatica]RFS26880.1 glycosyltransferase family 2 protein [Chitinophaga silvatica]
MPNHKISFCTVSMNRLHHIKDTLIKNIRDNEDYEQLEFVLLDYNSTDGLEEYIKENLQEYIQSQKLIYWKTSTPQFFHRSHSRNLAFKLANGDIVCNIDADNYTGKGFASYINQSFSNDPNICLNTLDKEKGGVVGKDALGRICVRKSDFLQIKGFDERMHCYGFEDYDFINRLELFGVKRVLIENKNFLSAIYHSDKDRLSQEYTINNLIKFLLRHIDPLTSEFVFLFKDHSFNRAIVEDHQPRKIMQLIKEGKWQREEEYINILEKGDNTDRLIFSGDDLGWESTYTQNLFYEISDPSMIQTAIFIFSQFYNKQIMESNMQENKMIVNVHGFGNDFIYKNFNITEPLTLK